MAKRTGLPSVQRLALQMCRLISRYQGLIVVLYPANPALHAALAAALAACEELRVEIAPVLEQGV